MLPKVKTPNQTLVVEYVDGTSLRVPYFDRQEAMWFIHMEGDHVKDYRVEEYKDE